MPTHETPIDDVALFIDVDNIWIATKNDGLPFQPKAIHERARLLGRVIMARAYADWSESYLYEARTKLQEEAFDLVQLPGNQRGKNTADIQLAVDALEAALGPRPPSTVVLVSGDRDFVPLATKLRKHRIQVVGIAAASSAGRQFKNACDLYVEYDDLVGPVAAAEVAAPSLSSQPQADKSKGKQIVATEQGVAPIGSKEELIAAFARSSKEDEARRLLAKAVAHLERQGLEAKGASAVPMMQRLDNSFSLEKFDRYAKFIDLAKDAEQSGYVKISKPSVGDFTLVLTDLGRSVASSTTPVDLQYSSPESERRHYEQIMARKRVSLVPYPWRSTLVEELFKEIEAASGMTIRDMTDWTLNSARRVHAMDVSVDMIRKLIWSLNLAGSFKDEYGYAGEQRDEDQKLMAAISPSEANYRIEVRYLTGVLLEDPEAPLTPDAIALWLFGSGNKPDLQVRAAELVEAARQRRRF